MISFMKIPKVFYKVSLPCIRSCLFLICIHQENHYKHNIRNSLVYIYNPEENTGLFGLKTT